MHPAWKSGVLHSHTSAASTLLSLVILHWRYFWFLVPGTGHCLNEAKKLLSCEVKWYYDHTEHNFFKWRTTFAGLGDVCVNHCDHFIFERCKNLKVQSIEVLLIDNRRSSQEHIMEPRKIDENQVYNLFSIGKANREINALPISHAVHPDSVGSESKAHLCTRTSSRSSAELTASSQKKVKLTQT